MRARTALHQAAPVDDAPDEAPGELAETREQVRRGETVSLAEARRALAEDESQSGCKSACAFWTFRSKARQAVRPRCSSCS